jgi:hypothetical protein
MIALRDDRVENGEELTETGDESDLVWPAAPNAARGGGFDDGIVPNGDACGDGQDVADAASSAADHAMAAPGGRILVEWRAADESGQLAAIARAFGQFGDEFSRSLGQRPAPRSRDPACARRARRGRRYRYRERCPRVLFQESERAVSWRGAWRRAGMASMPIISTTCRRLATRSPSLRARWATGRACGLIRSAKRAMTCASMDRSWRAFRAPGRNPSSGAD